jgi:hypothetical protein
MGKQAKTRQLRSQELSMKEHHLKAQRVNEILYMMTSPVPSAESLAFAAQPAKSTRNLQGPVQELLRAKPQ